MPANLKTRVRKSAKAVLDRIVHEIIDARRGGERKSDLLQRLMDAKDEEYRDGVHAVVGHIDRETPDFHVEISIDGSRFKMTFDQLFKGFHKRRVNVPSEWFDQLKVRVKRPTTSWA